MNQNNDKVEVEGFYFDLPNQDKEFAIAISLLLLDEIAEIEKQYETMKRLLGENIPKYVLDYMHQRFENIADSILYLEDITYDEDE